MTFRRSSGADPQPAHGADGVAVVGGGIVGLAVSLRLAQLGADVTLLDAGQLGGGATGTTFAWLNSSNKAPRSYHQLNVAGMAEYRSLRQELGGAPWLHLDGHIEWRTSDQGPASLEAKAARLERWGYPVRTVSTSDLAALCPEVRVPAAVEAALYAPDEGYVEPAGLVADLAGRARAAGVRVRPEVRVADLELARGSVRALVTAAGERVSVSTVVLCPGAEIGPLVAALGFEIPMRHAPGLLVYTAPAPVECRLTITSPTVNIRPDGADRFCLQAIELDERAATTSDVGAVAEEVLDRARRVLPGLRRAGVEEWRVAQRPIPADGLPVVGRIPTTANAYLAVSHSGITLGPLLGRLLAAEVWLGRRDARLAEFGPERLRAGQSGSLA